jgi:hypothetical protein
MTACEKMASDRRGWGECPIAGVEQMRMSAKPPPDIRAVSRSMGEPGSEGSRPVTHVGHQCWGTDVNT